METGIINEGEAVLMRMLKGPNRIVKNFYGVDVDDCPELAAEYRVQSVPCLVLMKKGEFVSQSIGFKPQPAIAAWIQSNL